MWWSRVGRNGTTYLKADKGDARPPRSSVGGTRRVVRGNFACPSSLFQHLRLTRLPNLFQCNNAHWHNKKFCMNELAIAEHVDYNEQMGGYKYKKE